MASYLVQADTSLYRVSPAGVATAITLPAGITLYGAETPVRAALMTRGTSAVVAVVNGANHDFYITNTGDAYGFNLAAPSAACTVAAGAGTGLTGVYKVAVTFKIKDANGGLIAESGLGPIGTGASVTNKTLALTFVPISEHPACNARGIYRTAAGGNIFYPWFDLDGNSIASVDRGGSDTLLALQAVDYGVLGSPPDFSILCNWRDRFWGVPRLQPDNLRWSEERVFYAWPARNEIVMPPQNVESQEAPAFIPRRDALGIAHAGTFFQIVGYSNETFQRQVIDTNIGVRSQESVLVVNNTGYFLGRNAGRIVVYEWTDEGLRPISEAQVDAWFNTDIYFNTALFSKAQGRYNPDTDAYELLLAAAGSSNLDRWVSFSIQTRQWYGPHKTAAFTPTCVGLDAVAYEGTLGDSSADPLTVFGGTDGFLYKRDASLYNDDGDAIDFDVDLPFLSANSPDIEKVWLMPSIHSKVESGGVLTITPKVGGLAASAGAAISHSLTTGRERLRRLGLGRYVQLNLRQNTTSQGVTVFGIELPWITRGRR